MEHSSEYSANNILTVATHLWLLGYTGYLINQRLARLASRPCLARQFGRYYRSRIIKCQTNLTLVIGHLILFCYFQEIRTMSLRQSITSRGAITALLILQMIALILFPPESFSVDSQEW